MKIKYLISSNINYYKNTYQVLVTSLLESSIPPSDIVMVVGGCEPGSILTDNYLNINLVPVEYNSFDLTALIYVADNLDNLDFTHIFLMHDTCLVGPKFGELSKQFEAKDVIKTLLPELSMNIGLYSKYIIENNLINILNFKFYPTSPEELQQVKEFFVVNEDIIFLTYPSQCYTNYYMTGGRNNLNLNDLKSIFNKSPYTEYFNKLSHSNIQREIGYGEELDFYKLQANTKWGGLWKVGL